MTERFIAATATCDLPINMDEFASAIGDGFRVEVVPLPFGEMSLRQRDHFWGLLEGASGLFVRTGNVPYELLSRCPDLRVIALHGVGVDQVDVKAATEAGIYVTNVPGGNAVSVVELTFGLMLSLLRQIPKADSLMRRGQWESARTVGRELSGKRLGLVGFGNIAARVASVAEAFGMEVVYWSRSPKNTRLAAYVDLDDLFATSDIVSLHIPLTDETRHLVDRTRLCRLKPHAVLINTARGGVINQADLLQALREEWFAGAGLDVFVEEPLPFDSPFLQLPNVVLTPHMAGSTEECLVRLARTAGADIRRVLNDEKPRYPVNQPWGRGN